MRKNRISYRDNFYSNSFDGDYFSTQVDYVARPKLPVSRDIVASTKTNAIALVNQDFTSAIDKPNDVDWIKLNLSAGHTYQISLSGLDSNQGSLSDPLIKGLYNASGKSLGSIYVDDDSGIGRDSILSFTPTKTGAYFVAAAGYGKAIGTYSLLVSEDLTAPTLTSLEPSNGSTQVSASTNIVAQFSETILASSGSIHIVGDDGHELNILASDANQVQILGDQIHINPSVSLHEGVTYTVTFDENSIKDTSGNQFAGISAGTFSFTISETSDLPVVDKEWTIMVYVAADNDLESYALMDLNELEEVANSSTVSITALVDRADGYDSSNGDWVEARVGQIDYDVTSSVISLTESESWGELNTGNPQSLTDFILWSVENQPAQNYALVIWNHGGGIDGIAWDDSSSGYLTVNELSTAVSNAVNYSNSDTLEKFGLIAMDACLMGMVEVAYPLTNLTDYLVMSEELVPGTGFAYDDWIRNFLSSGSSLASDLASSALTSYASEYNNDSDITLSSLDTTKMSILIDALNSFTNLAISASARDLKAISKVVSGARDFPSDQSYDFGDLGHAMDLIAGSRSIASLPLKNAASAVSDAVDLLVVDEVGTVTQASGLSIYLPYGTDIVMSSYNSTNYSFLQSVPLWDDFLRVI